MHAYLVTGGIKTDRDNKIKELLTTHRTSKFDTVDLEKEGLSIGITRVREFQKRLILAPINSPWITGIIHEADTLTVEAQQALLKTIEEPPPRVKIILESFSCLSLLPTIVSRCQVIILENKLAADDKLVNACYQTIEKIRKLSPGKRLPITDEVAKTKDEALAWVDTATAAVRQKLLENAGKDPDRSAKLVSLSRGLIRAKHELSANVNFRLVLDNLFLGEF